MSTISVKCPKCRELLEVDTRTGAILRHQEEVRPKPGADFLGERLRALDQDQARREAIVAEGRRKEQERRGEIEKLFRKATEGNKPEPY